MARPSPGSKPISQETPITAESLVDVLEIQCVIDAQANAYDTQQWGLARSLLTDKLETTILQKDGIAVAILFRTLDVEHVPLLL
ncbi:hypothetical protein AM10699_40360 [Acaryochloris marina MBIC10699]|nr:hypothetical protein AM10699_40360 [Acaryochloris marina MBIC10699]